MLIKNIEVVDRVKQFKHSIYRLVRQITASMAFDTVSLLHIFLIHLIIGFLFVSIYFKANDFFPTSISQGTSHPTQSSASSSSPTSQLPFPSTL